MKILSPAGPAPSIWERSQHTRVPVIERAYVPTRGSCIDPRTSRQALAVLRLVGADPAGIPDSQALARLQRNVAGLTELAWIPGRSSIFVDLRVRAESPRSLEIHLGLGMFGDDDAARECEDLAVAARAAIERFPVVYRFEPVDPLPLATSAVVGAHGMRIAQRVIDVSDGDAVCDVVSRFDGLATDWLPVCEILLERPGAGRIRVCMAATSLGPDHELALIDGCDALSDMRERAGGASDARIERAISTVKDLQESLRGVLYAGEIVINTSSPLTQMTVRAIASQITSEVDIVNAPEFGGMSTPSVAARRRLVGGYELEPIDPRLSYALTDAMPSRGCVLPARMQDLWTATETALAFKLPAPVGRAIPTITTRAPLSLAAPAGRPGAGALIGRDSVGDAVYLDEAALGRHVHIVGASGSGKSTAQIRMAEHDLEQGRSFLVVDPHGDTALIIEERARAHGRAAVIVDASREDSTAISLGAELDSSDALVRGAAVDRATATILAALTGHLPPEYSGPRGGRILSAALQCIMHGTSHGRLADAGRLLTDPAYRAQVLASPDIPDGARTVIEQEARAQDAAGTLGWASCKIDDVTRPTGIDRLIAPFGQGLDLSEAFACGIPVIMRLAKGDLGGYESARVGQLLLTLACESVFARAPHERTPLRFYVDEIHSFPAPNLRRLLDEARKFNVSLVAAHQTLSQLPDDLLDSLLGNPQTRIVFRTTTSDSHHFAPDLGVPARSIAAQPNLSAIIQMTTAAGPLAPFTVLLDPPPPTPDPTVRPAPSGAEPGTPAVDPPRGRRARAGERQLVLALKAADASRSSTAGSSPGG